MRNPLKSSLAAATAAFVTAAGAGADSPDEDLASMEGAVFTGASAGGAVERGAALIASS
jgi:hypothetical protein